MYSSLVLLLVVTFDGYTKSLSILVLMFKLPNNSLVIMGVATFGDCTKKAAYTCVNV